MRAGIEPVRESLPPRGPVCLAGKVGENQLGYILGAMRVAVHLPQHCQISQVRVPLNQFRKGVLGLGLRAAAQQFTISRTGERGLLPGCGAGNVRWVG
ncbi:MAG TPA: hypothetical protein PLC99_13910 [Verrucomicrobiota bacterium]|nr:hypothetical protein [Verrucomicrobiota bacterium]